MERNLKDTPKTFHGVKKEFDRIMNFALAKAKTNNKEKELENYSILFGLIQEFNNFIKKYEEEVSVGIKDRMDELDKYKVLLSDFGKKIEWDEEANWLYFSDMNEKDWREDTKISNEKYLKKRAEKKLLKGEI